jgi:hypothetical protein
MLVRPSLGQRNRSNLGFQDKNMQWQRLDLANVTNSVSTTGLVSAAQASTGIWTVVMEEQESNVPGEGYLVAWKNQHDWDWDDFQWASVAIEVLTKSNAASSETYVMAGIAPTPESMPAAGGSGGNMGGVGLMYDTNNDANPDVAVVLGANSAPNYSAAQAGTLGVIGNFYLGPDRKFLNVTASACSATGNNPTWKYTKRATATLAIADADPNFGFWLALGQNGNGTQSANVTLTFRVWAMLSGRQATWFPV